MVTNTTANPEKSIKSLKITQFLNKEDKKQLQSYFNEIPIGRVKALCNLDVTKNDVNSEKLVKVKTLGLMISPFAILLPNGFVNDSLRISSMKFIPVNEKYKNNIFRIKHISKKTFEDWRIVFLEGGIGEFLFQVNQKDEYYFKLDDIKFSQKNLTFVGYYVENFQEEEKFVFRSKIYNVTSYMISSNKEKLFFLSKVPISNGFFYLENHQILAVFNGEEMYEDTNNYKNWYLESVAIDRLESGIDPKIYRYGAHILTKEEKSVIYKTNDEYHSILVQEHVTKFDQQIYSLVLNYANTEEKVKNLIIGGKRSIDRVCKIYGVDSSLLEHDLVYKSILSELDKNNEISKLELQSSGVDCRNLKNSFDCYYFSQTLTYLDLTGVRLDRIACLDLSEFLHYNKSVRTLILTNTGLSHDTLEIVCGGIKQNASLEVLNIGQNHLRNKINPNKSENENAEASIAAMLIVDMLVNLKTKKGAKKIFTFICYENDFFADDSLYIFKNIKGNIEFKYLNYSDAAMISSVCEIFSSILYNNITLKELVLSNCDIVDDGFEKLTNGFANCINLNKLDLSKNQITSESMKNFSNFYLRTIKSFNLVNKYKRFDEDEDLENTSRTKLKFLEEFTLILDHNRIEFEGIVDIFKGFSSESPFLILSLVNTSIKRSDSSDYLWKPFDSLFVNNVPIKKLFLQMNNLKDGDVSKMFQNLQNCETIHLVNLCKNQITIKGIISITDKLRGDLNFQLIIDKYSKQLDVNESLNLSKNSNKEPGERTDRKKLTNLSLKSRLSEISTKIPNKESIKRIMGFLYFIESKKKSKK